MLFAEYIYILLMQRTKLIYLPSTYLGEHCEGSRKIVNINEMQNKQNEMTST